MRLIDLLNKVKATHYISGPSAKSYISEADFKNNKILITWMNYNSYPEYNQLYTPFDHNVSIIDLLFNEGINASHFMLYSGRKSPSTLKVSCSPLPSV